MSLDSSAIWRRTSRMIWIIGGAGLGAAPRPDGVLSTW